MTYSNHNKMLYRLIQLGMTLALFIASSTPLLAQTPMHTLTITPQENGVVSIDTPTAVRAALCGTENRYDSSVAGVSTGFTTCVFAAPQGAQATLTAIPNLYYNFIGWLGDCTGSTAEITITLDADQTCQAVFAKPDGYVQVGTTAFLFEYHTCALTRNGSVHCWGSNSDGQLGDGMTDNRVAPTIATGISNVVDVSVGVQYTCAVLRDGQARCWGDNTQGQLGDGTLGTDRLMPTPVPGVSTAVTIAAGYQHTCAVLSDGAVLCWGANGGGQLGDGTSTRRLIPTTTSDINTAIAVSAGFTHTCAVLRDGQARCWGVNSDDQLGDGTTQRSRVPTTVSGVNTVISISAGFTHTCAVLRDGQARCWGNNSFGRLGNGTTQLSRVPTTVSGVNTAVDISAGASHSCAVLSDGQAQCWGNGGNGRLGDGDSNQHDTPTTVTGLNTASDIAAGATATCALLRNGLAYCWGADTDGVIGNGAPSGTYTSPQLVANQEFTQSPLQILAVFNTLFVFQPRIAANVNRWSLPSTPTRLRLNTISGALYGTPSSRFTDTLTAHTAGGDIPFTFDLIVTNAGGLLVDDSDDSTNTIRENAQRGEPVGGLRLRAQANAQTITDIDWSLTEGNDAFRIDSSGRVLVADPTGFTSGTSVTIAVIARNNDIQSVMRTFTIHITEAVHAIRFHLKLFLEGPLQ